MMSLLNDMLRDLSHQQQATETVAPPQAELDFNAQEQRELFYHTRAVKPLPRTLVPSIAIFLLVLALFSLWKMELFSQPDNGITPTGLNAATAQPVLPVTAMQSASTPATVAAHPLISSPVQSVENNVVEPELGKRIAALESAINNLSAVVADTNSHTTNEPTTDPDFGRESGYENEFAEVDAQRENKFSNAGQLSQQPGGDLSESVSIQEPFAQPSGESSVAEQSFTEPALSGSSLTWQSPTEQAPLDQSEPQFSIEPNIKWQDQQQAQQANQLVTQGQTDSAIKKLQAYIATAAQPRESVKTLLDIYATQENVSAIQTLLAQANYLSVDELSFYNAKIAVVQQKEALAIQLLEENLDKAEQNENYRALLAGLYQHSGKHLEAANHYRRLLSVFGDKPAYWLGFALSQDALNQSKVAAQAYQRVNQYADLQPQVRTYVQQRIAALQN